jgi:integrase
MLLDKGVHPRFVQNLLGHKSVKITLDLYSYLIPDMGNHAAYAMDDIF